MASDTKRFNQLMDTLETLVTAMCIIYGLTLLLIYFSFNNRIMPCFLDPLIIGLLFFFLGIYPITKKKSIERMKKRKGKWF